MRPFRIDLSTARLDEIRSRIEGFRWDAMPNLDGWEAGASSSFMWEVAAYWSQHYDWRAQERELNRFPQFVAPVHGVDIHFFHVRSRHPGARPLLLLHGWPGSFFEFLHLVEPLTDPEAFGGDAADAFHVVLPSLPGYGFSGRPSAPIGPAAVARMFASLMAETLQYPDYLVQGGDWGAIIASLMGFQDACCSGIHLNMVVPRLSQPAEGEEETIWTERFLAAMQSEGAYGALQRSKPQSLGFAMNDSPLGVAAWIIEKFASWSDLPLTRSGEPDLLARYSMDQLITNVMIYLANDSFVSSTWLYAGYKAEVQDLPFTRGERCPAPTGIAAFPDPVFLPQPRSMVERNHNVVTWTKMPRGGHFAALEAPDLLLEDLRTFARVLDAQTGRRERA